MNEQHSSAPNMPDRVRTVWQYILPQHALSRFVHWVTRLRLPVCKNLLIKAFIRHYGVEMSEAAQPDPETYVCFNAFFTRKLKQNARPVPKDPAAVISPIDGIVSQLGRMTAGRIVQAKGIDFSLSELLGDDTAFADKFAAGAFATLYLAPRDYHRVHMPLTGRLTRMIHVPGALFSVNPISTRAIPRLFARNERVATLFDCEAGAWGLVMVGALCVGSIETVWAGEITPPRGRRIRTWSYQGSGDAELILTRGAELGRFNMGSTVILLFPEDRVRWLPELAPGARIKMGQALGVAHRLHFLSRTAPGG
jgi:phosphatidylserine decarboxylase